VNDSKKQAIKKALLETKARRSDLICKVITVKIDYSHLNMQQKEFLRLVFLEAKWFSNDILSQKDVFKYDTKVKKVLALNKEKIPEERELKVLGSQIKQELYHKIKQNIVTLSKVKKTGRKVGRLKFKKTVSSLPLKQFGKTYGIKGNYIKIQGCDKHFKVSGLKQIKEGIEIADANLVHKGKDYFLKITTFSPKDKSRIKTGKSVGIDFGIETTLTTSDGEKINVKFPETKRLKRLQKGFSRKLKGSNNRRKQNETIQMEYERISNRKRDLKNKVVCKIVKDYDLVVVQDENVQEWKQGWFGKGVQKSLISGIISDLSKKSETFIKIDRYYPSTKTCDVCNNVQNITLKERIFKCNVCGNVKDRDIHSAINILSEGIRVLGANTYSCGLGKVKTSTRLKQEAVRL